MRKTFGLGLSLAALILAFLAACWSGGGPGPRSSEGFADLGPPPAAEDLEPVIGESGALGGVPRRIVVELARAVADDSPPQQALDPELYRIEPPVAGSLRFTGPSTLVFEAEEPFAPGTRFVFTLLGVPTGAGVVAAPGEGWRRELNTPPFALLRFSPMVTEEVRGTVEAQLLFSAPVDLPSLRRHARFSVVDERGRETPAQIVELVAGAEPRAARVRLGSPRLVPGRQVRLELEEGAHLAGNRDVVAPAASARLTLQEGARMDLLALFPVEGSGGFYLEAVCHDGSVEGERYYWDRHHGQGYPRLSPRCVLDQESLASHLRIEPHRAVTVAPSAGGFRIFGDFTRGSYAVRLDAGARTQDGGSLQQDYETTFSVAARSPHVAFVARGRYLPRSAWSSLAVRHRNLDRVTLSVRHVPDANLLFWMGDERDESATERTSDLVVRREIPVRGGADELATSYLDVASLVPAETRGLLELTLEGHRGARDTARILLTDLQLVAKRTGGDPSRPWGREVHVWALESLDLEPLSGVEIQLVRRSGFVLARCATGSSGGCRLPVPEEGLDPSPPFALVAKRGSDLTYLRFGDLEAEVQQERVGGEPYRSERAYRAALYSDRGVYRPGETAHLVAVLRDEANAAPPAGMPVTLRLVDPRGRVSSQLALEVNAAGVATADPTFASFATTGRYEARLEVAGEEAARYVFLVEELVPERLEVHAAAGGEGFLLGEEVPFSVRARYLFGGVPAGHRVELSCELEPAPFAPSRHTGFSFGPWLPAGETPRPVPLGSAAGVLDADGSAALACAGRGGPGALQGPARLVARAAVFEAGSGRTTVGQAQVPVHPAPFYLGLATGARQLAAGEELAVHGVVVGWEGDFVTEIREVDVELLALEEEYGWYYDERLGHETFRRFLRPVPAERRRVAVADGRFELDWRPARDAAAFLVRARAGDARTDLEVAGDGARYYWDPRESRAQRTARPDRAHWIELEAPERARVGEHVTVRFAAPFGGRVLLTAETDELLAAEWLRVEAGEVRWSFPLRRFEPNVYVTALVVKDPRLDSPGAFLPDRAFGVRSVPVEPTELTQRVALRTPEEVRSGSPLTVELELGPLEGPTWATVAAVDEGVLSLTRFTSPDPLAQIVSRRALGVATFETVGWTLALPYAGPSSRTGGDLLEIEGRIQAVKPVALWSGLLEVPADGRLSVTLPVPTYRGALRVMAVTAGPRKLGRAEARVVVRDPLTLQATLLRFLTFGDQVEVPVAVTNLSGRPREVTVAFEASGEPEGAEVTLTGPGRQVLTLADGAAGVARFSLRAGAVPGGATMRVAARSGELAFSEEARVPVVPAAPRSRRVERLELEAGVTDLAPHLAGWVPFTERSTFWVTANPYGDVFDHLKFLVRYPYGCVEQTVSTTRPLLYLPELLGSLDPELLEEGPVEAMAVAGIERTLSMQTPTGGFAYWPGGLEPAPWASAYATHLLLDARTLRYPVDPGRLENALGWLEQEVARSARGERRQDGYVTDAEPYMHYVLALGGRGQKGRALRLVDEAPSAPRYEEREHLYLLKAALYLAGDRRFERDLRDPDLSPLSDYRDNRWSFYSDRRMRGLMLSVYADLFGRGPAGDRLASLVAEGLRGHPSAYFTTQELVWGITGLGKYLETGARDFAPPVLRAGGRVVPPEPRPPGAAGRDRTWSLYRASERGAMTLEVPAKGEGKLYLVLSSEGVLEEGGAAYGGEGLRMTRRLLGEGGEPLDPGLPMELGALVHVELTLENTSPERIANVALVDRIPAGWEVENPRLGRGRAVEWLDPATLWEPDHLELRDDRVEVFGHLERGETRKVLYTARAVTAGRFTQPPAEAEAMYDPRIWARVEGSEVRVSGPGTRDEGSAVDR